MADLDPLKYVVAIQDEATRKLDEIERRFLQLQDKSISVKVDGLEDLRNLLSAYLCIMNCLKMMRREY